MACEVSKHFAVFGLVKHRRAAWGCLGQAPAEPCASPRSPVRAAPGAPSLRACCSTRARARRPLPRCAWPPPCRGARRLRRDQPARSSEAPARSGRPAPARAPFACCTGHAGMHGGGGRGPRRARRQVQEGGGVCAGGVAGCRQGAGAAAMRPLRTATSCTRWPFECCRRVASVRVMVCVQMSENAQKSTTS